MPVTCKIQSSGKWKLVEAATGKVAKHSGNHPSRSACMTQARAVNRNLHSTENHVVDVIGLIGLDFTAQDFKESIKERGEKDLEICIASKGGSVLDAIQIVNDMRKETGKKKVIVESAALSAAFIIAMGGDEVHMASNAIMMSHPPTLSGDTLVGKQLTAEELRNAAEMVDTGKEALKETLIARVGEEEAESLLTNTVWLTARQAKEKGLVDKIIDASDLRITNSDLSNYNNVPDVILAMVKKPVRKSVPVSKSLESHMDILDYAKKVGVSLADDADDEEIQEALENHFKSQRTRRRKRRSSNIPENVKTEILKSRKVQIENLAKELKIKKTQADSLLNQYCSDTVIEKILNGVDDGFDAQIKLLNENESFAKGSAKKVELEDYADEYGKPGEYEKGSYDDPALLLNLDRN